MHVFFISNSIIIFINITNDFIMKMIPTSFVELTKEGGTSITKIASKNDATLSDASDEGSGQGKILFKNAIQHL